jgi:hypothetical protein
MLNNGTAEKSLNLTLPTTGRQLSGCADQQRLRGRGNGSLTLTVPGAVWPGLDSQ